MVVRGLARYDPRTKDLVRRLRPGNIALIDHPDLDEVAARAIVRAGGRAVLNLACSVTGRYPNLGPRVLLQAGLTVLDQVRAPAGTPLYAPALDGRFLEIRGETVYSGGRAVARGRVLTRQRLGQRLKAARANLERELDGFLENTMRHALREKVLVLGELAVPRCRTRLDGRHVLVVVRGRGYLEDLAAIRPYVHDLRPVLVGVDGGADALLEAGYRPHLIVGDMDSVSDQALRSGAELVVHAYPDGRAPGLARVRALGLEAAHFPAPGTSEDVAMLLAYESGAALIVAVGTHSNIIDFLEKGRPGMGSTFLVRSKVGPILVDAKGVSQLYPRRFRPAYLAQLVLAALLPLTALATLSGPARSLLRLLLLQIRVRLGV
ncbi:MAG: putative cytokinetic ring protein SteA [bacterium]|nr:putative cytokinetic ring protein SteA [bacterium]